MFYYMMLQFGGAIFDQLFLFYYLLLQILNEHILVFSHSVHAHIGGNLWETIWSCTFPNPEFAQPADGHPPAEVRRLNHEHNLLFDMPP